VFCSNTPFRHLMKVGVQLSEYQ